MPYTATEMPQPLTTTLLVEWTPTSQMLKRWYTHSLVTVLMFSNLWPP
jgi:hypothetical protein